MPLDEGQALSSLSMAIAGTQFYSAALPSIFTIRRFPDQFAAEDIRDGERFATVATISLGAIVSAMLDSKVPLVMAFAVSAVMVAMYEWALSTSRTEGFLGPEDT